ncbi:hypothetical protein [Variovorax sp. dw_308]|uniref:hypothetical protein n=1 Tax=Variovorax sp. dw_308 TaxID=2721546 RepID=UPI001C47C0B8
MHVRVVVSLTVSFSAVAACPACPPASQVAPAGAASRLPAPPQSPDTGGIGIGLRRTESTDIARLCRWACPAPCHPCDAGSYRVDLAPAPPKIKGGAIAPGHPPGASGMKRMTTLVNALGRRARPQALQTMRQGGSMANVTLLERP